MKLSHSLVILCLTISFTLKAVSDPNISVFHYSKAESKTVELLIEKMNRVVDKKADLTVADILSVVNVDPRDVSKITSAYPNPMSVNCKGMACGFNGVGQEVEARTYNTTSDPEMDGIILGIKSQVTGSFLVDGSNPAATVCNINGVYLAKLVFRKNVRAFKVELSADGATVTLWMAGAQTLPNC